MKKTNTTIEANATQTTEVQNTKTQATKATTKKEEKKMSKTTETKATATITIPESIDQNIFKAYKVNEAGELLMSNDMIKEFIEAHTEVKVCKVVNDQTKAQVKLPTKGAKAFAYIRLDETAKKKQVHNHTGATKKVCSQRDDKTGIRYKVIFRAKTEKHELWSADAAGKRKMVKRGTEAEVMAEYNKLLGIVTEVAPKKATRTSKKSEKKSA